MVGHLRSGQSLRRADFVGRRCVGVVDRGRRSSLGPWRGNATEMILGGYLVVPFVMAAGLRCLTASMHY
jgi:hypothetical protein